MAFVLKDRVKDTSTTTGTGSFTVSGTAPTGFQTFDDVMSSSDTTFYAIIHQTLGEWEVGVGTYSGSNVLARTTVTASSNSGSAVDFGSGTKDVFMDVPASAVALIGRNVTPVFDTKSDAEAYAPLTAPDQIRIEGYTSAGDGGGALYKKVDGEPSHEGKFSITLSDGETVAWYELAEILVGARMLGAVGDGETDNSTAITAARGAAGANRPILIDGGDFDSSLFQNLYGSWAEDALGCKLSLGDASRCEPIVWVEKKTAADRTSTEWDQGSAYFAVMKTGGSAPVAALTSYVITTKDADAAHASANSAVAHHSRARAQGAYADVWAGWDYAVSWAFGDNDRVNNVIGREIDINNRDADYGWQARVARGRHDGLAITMSESGPSVTWKTISTTSGSPVATVSPSAVGLVVGMTVTSANIPGGTTVTAIVGNTLTLSANATATAADTAATFASSVSLPGTHAIRITNHNLGASAATGWWTGLQISQNAIMPSRNGHGEAILIRGGSSVSRRYGGLRFFDGDFDYGISFAGDPVGASTTIDTTSGSAVVVVADPSKVYVGAVITSANLPEGAKVTAIDGVNVTLDEEATATASGTTATFQFDATPAFSNNAAIWLGNGHRIVWGDTTGGNYFIQKSAGGFFQIVANGIPLIAMSASGSAIFTLPSTPATLGSARTMVMSVPDDETLRISVRGSDGVTRKVDLTLS